MTHPAGGEITSLRSPRVKAARQLAKRAFRQRARSFLAEGPQSVGAALESGAEITELFVTAPAASRHGGLVAGAARRGAPVQQVSGEVMAELAQTVTPQGLLAVCRFIDIPLNQLTSRLAAARPGLVVILANVRDPGNAGTVLRTADAAGADGVVFAGADGGGPARLDDPALAARLAGPAAWLFGNEAWGLPADLLALADEAVAVPIYGQAESLNLAAAAAVCLYASAREQRMAGQRS